MDNRTECGSVRVIACGKVLPTSLSKVLCQTSRSIGDLITGTIVLGLDLSSAASHCLAKESGSRPLRVSLEQTLVQT